MPITLDDVLLCWAFCSRSIKKTNAWIGVWGGGQLGELGGFDYSVFLSFFFSPFPVLLSSRAADLPGSMSGRESVAVSFDAVQPKYAVLFLKTLSIRLSEARMSLLIFGSRCDFFFFWAGVDLAHSCAVGCARSPRSISHLGSGFPFLC